MGTRLLLPLTALGLLLVAAADKPEKSLVPRIAILIEQLGNDDFNERENASTALEALGEPALDGLRQAVKSSDAEVRRRAETLIVKIEKSLETTNALTAKRVHLIYKDTPLKDALEDFEKKCGYSLTLFYPENKLNARPITLDTGDAPFWQAFEQFCHKAGLVEFESFELAAGGIAVGVSDHTTLSQRKAATSPTDAASAVRIRVLNRLDASGVRQDSEIPLTLHLSLEPRLQWRTLGAVTITRAVDDQKQDLTPLAELAPGNLREASLHQDVFFRLNKGGKVSTTLTELTGTVSASIFTETKPIITAPDIFNATGKTFQGGDNGQLKVVEVSKDANGQITIRVELQAPTGVVPGVGLMGRGAIRRLNRGVPVAVAPPAGGAVAVRGAVFIGPGAGAGVSAGALSLLDDKGEAVPLVGVQMQFTAVVGPGGGILNRLQQILTFQADKGQEASKLIYSGRKMLNVDIPFTLKDVLLP